MHITGIITLLYWSSNHTGGLPMQTRFDPIAVGAIVRFLTERSELRCLVEIGSRIQPSINRILIYGTLPGNTVPNQVMIITDDGYGLLIKVYDATGVTQVSGGLSFQDHKLSTLFGWLYPNLAVRGIPVEQVLENAH